MRGALIRKHHEIGIPPISNDQLIPNGNYHALIFETLMYDTDGFYNTLEPTKIIIPNGIAKAKFYAGAIWEQNGIGMRQLILFKNNWFAPGIPVTNQIPVINTTTDMTFSSPFIDVIPGDYFQIMVNHDAKNHNGTIGEPPILIPLKVKGATATYFGIEAE